MSAEFIGGRDPAYDYRLDPTLLNPVTPREVSAFVSHTGQLFTQALTLAGHIGMAEKLPPSSNVAFDPRALQDLPDMSMWESGFIQYSPALGLGWDEASPDPDAYEVVSPASVMVSFEGEAHNLRGSRFQRGYTLVPSLSEVQVPIIDNRQLELDTDALHVSSEEVRQIMAGIESPDAALAEDEQIQALFGIRPNVITRLELKQLGVLVTASIRPETVRIDE